MTDAELLEAAAIAAKAFEDQSDKPWPNFSLLVDPLNRGDVIQMKRYADGHHDRC